MCDQKLPPSNHIDHLPRYKHTFIFIGGDDSKSVLVCSNQNVFDYDY